MSTLLNSVLLTSHTHPYLTALTLITLSLLLLLLLLLAATLTLPLLHPPFSSSEYEYISDSENRSDPIFIADETRPLLLAGRRNQEQEQYQDPLKDYPCGRFVTRTVSAKRARRQERNRRVLRRLLERDWVESSYGGVGKRGKRVGVLEGGEGEGEGGW